MENKNFGVALIRCFFCGKEKGLIMNSRLTAKAAKAVKECNGKAIDLEPCDDCKELMRQGVMLIEYKEGTEPDFYRTGVLVVVKDEAIKNVFPDDIATDAIKRRFCFVSDTIWDKLGLPRGGQVMFYYILNSDLSVDISPATRLSDVLSEGLRRGVIARSVIIKQYEITNFGELEKVIIELLRDKFELDYKGELKGNEYEKYKNRSYKH